MELLVHVSTSGHLLVVGSLEVVPLVVTHIIIINVHVTMVTPTPHLPLWAMTIFVRVYVHMVLMSISVSIHMLYCGMEGTVRVVAGAVGSTIHHGSPRT